MFPNLFWPRNPFALRKIYGTLNKTLLYCGVFTQTKNYATACPQITIIKNYYILYCDTIFLRNTIFALRNSGVPPDI